METNLPETLEDFILFIKSLDPGKYSTENDGRDVITVAEESKSRNEILNEWRGGFPETPVIPDMRTEGEMNIIVT